jgi:hypothetical protein
MLAKLEYISWVEKSLELNYRVLKIVVLLCNWVKLNYSGNSATMKRNKYGFTLVNFASLIPILNQSFCFPIACKTSFIFYRPKGKGLQGCFVKKTPKEVCYRKGSS